MFEGGEPVALMTTGLSWTGAAETQGVVSFIDVCFSGYFGLMRPDDKDFPHPVSASCLSWNE